MKELTLKSTLCLSLFAVAGLSMSALFAKPVTNVYNSMEKGNPYQVFTYDKDVYVPYDAGTTVLLDCPDAAAEDWLEDRFCEWYGKAAPKVKAGKANLKVAKDPEAYSVTADEKGVKVAANTIAGVRWASYTLRQIAIAKRGTFKTEGRILPKLSIVDRPHLSFRAIHFCWFPETRPEQIERSIRLAALLKFNYAIIEPWGTYKSEKHPWRAWPNANMTKAETKRLVKLGKELGITLIPQINTYGHASFSRGVSQKHSALDMNPEYEPLFEPGGWNWCLSNPETRRVLKELIAEIHDNFDCPPYFHLGFDEATKQSCPECIKHSNTKLVADHLISLVDFLKSRGARAMVWHDMFLDKKDARWKGFVACGNKETALALDKLPKDIIICDWQYSYGKMNEVRKDWPTIAYFASKGFPVAGCPWRNFNAMKPMCDFIVKNKGFGFIETTWHHMRGHEWEKMFLSSSHAAWGSPVSHGATFQISLRLVGNDMKVKDYKDSGIINEQIPPSWWSH
jgi:hypothetical protein